MQSTTEFQHICLIESNKQIDYPGSGNRSEFVFDGLSKNAKITEFASGTLISTKQFVWSKMLRAEERDGASSVVKQFFAKGQINGGNLYFHTLDRLLSIRELTNTSAGIVSQYSYYPYGRVHNLIRGLETDFQYAGYYRHERSILNLTHFRAYNSSIGRFMNRDLIAEDGGINLFTYVENSPIGFSDPAGLQGLLQKGIEAAPKIGDIGKGTIGFIGAFTLWLQEQLSKKDKWTPTEDDFTDSGEDSEGNMHGDNCRGNETICLRLCEIRFARALKDSSKTDKDKCKEEFDNCKVRCHWAGAECSRRFNAGGGFGKDEWKKWSKGDQKMGSQCCD